MPVTPAMLRLGPVLLGDGGLVELASLCAEVDGDWLVVLGAGLDEARRGIDEFVLAAAVAALRPGLRLGVATAVGDGRAASVIAREATCAQLLGACDALVLEGEPDACADAARIVAALFTPGHHSLTTPTASIADAVNDPSPSVAGGPPIRFRAGTELRGPSGSASEVVGTAGVLDLSSVARPGPWDLVVARHPPLRPRELREALCA